MKPDTCRYCGALIEQRGGRWYSLTLNPQWTAAACPGTTGEPIRKSRPNGPRRYVHRPVGPAPRHSLDGWRKSREPGWHKDIGYEIQSTLREHQYTRDKGDRPDDPGWHECTCRRWQGYWSDFHSHVADQLRIIVVGDSDSYQIEEEP